MHVFGGVLIPEERITNEHWALHLPTLTWSPLTLSPPPDYDVIDNSTSYSNLTGVADDSGVVVATSNENTVKLPLGVRSHTAHVVSTVMIVLFGMSDLQPDFFSFVQEYNLGVSPFHTTKLICPHSIPLFMPIEIIYSDLSSFHSRIGGVVCSSSERSGAPR